MPRPKSNASHQAPRRCPRRCYFVYFPSFPQIYLPRTRLFYGDLRHPDVLQSHPSLLPHPRGDLTCSFCPGGAPVEAGSLKKIISLADRENPPPTSTGYHSPLQSFVALFGEIYPGPVRLSLVSAGMSVARLSPRSFGSFSGEPSRLVSETASGATCTP